MSKQLDYITSLGVSVSQLVIIGLIIRKLARPPSLLALCLWRAAEMGFIKTFRFNCLVMHFNSGPLPPPQPPPHTLLLLNLRTTNISSPTLTHLYIKGEPTWRESCAITISGFIWEEGVVALSPSWRVRKCGKFEQTFLNKNLWN